MRMLGLWGSLLLAVPLAADEAPLTVFVTSAQVAERKKVDDATRKDLKAKRDAAREARKVLEKQIKAQHGKERDLWPPEKEAEFAEAEQAEAVARVDYEYIKVEPDKLKDSVKDIAESFQGKGMAGRKDVVLVNSADEAKLVVEVQGRRGEKTLPTQFKPDWCFVLFTLGPGGKTDPARFLKLPTDWKFKKFGLRAWQVATPKAEAPSFLYESQNTSMEFGCFGSAANTASVLTEKFIDNYRSLLGSDN
jgi:hypothetical protein